jgi:ATP-dependent DNA ligase
MSWDSFRSVANRSCVLSTLAEVTRCLLRFVNLGLEGIVSKKLNAPYKSGPSKVWLKIKNPKAPAATRATDGTF